MSLIYLSHSVKDYNTAYETILEDKVKEMFLGCNIINPKNVVVQPEDRIQLSGTYNGYIIMMKKYYYPIIDTVNTLVAAKSYNINRNKYSHGVQLEMEYAKLTGKPIYELSFEELGITK